MANVRHPDPARATSYGMKNPFETLLGKKKGNEEGEKAFDQPAIPKLDMLKQLRVDRERLEASMKIESHPDDAGRLDDLNGQISELESQL